MSSARASFVGICGDGEERFTGWLRATGQKMAGPTSLPPGGRPATRSPPTRTPSTESPDRRPAKCRCIPAVTSAALRAGPTTCRPNPYPGTSPSFGAPVPPPPFEPPSRERRPLGWSALLVVALIAALIGGAIGAISGVAYEHNHVNKAAPSDLSPGPPLATGSPTPIDPNPESVAQIAKKLLPSVVTLNVSGSTESGTGSGVIIRADGYILTNNHVVEVAANGGTITADFYNGKQKVPARIVGRDPKTDLAVVRVDGTNLPAATLGQSSSLVVGDPVVALGAPLGLSSTVTSGIVSALDRNVDVPDESGGSSGGLLIGAIQTDAAINPGNSGGPLVDDKAQVIGINSAIAAAPGNTGSTGGNIGVGFAIPIDYARSIADEIIRTGHATHPYVGVTAGPRHHREHQRREGHLGGARRAGRQGGPQARRRHHQGLGQDHRRGRRAGGRDPLAQGGRRRDDHLCAGRS